MAECCKQMFLLLCTNSVGKSILLSSKQKRISYSWNVSLEILLRALLTISPKDACNESNPRIIDDSRARKLANDLKRWKISNHLMVISSWLIWHFITSLLAGVLTTRPVLLMAWMWSVYSKTVKRLFVYHKFMIPYFDITETVDLLWINSMCTWLLWDI